MSKGIVTRRAVLAAGVVLTACAVLSPPALGFARTDSVQTLAQALTGTVTKQAGGPAVTTRLPLDDPSAQNLMGNGDRTLGELRSVNIPDLPENEADADAVRFVAYYGLIQGYRDGTFQTDGLLTRAQAVTVLRRTARLLGLEDTGVRRETSAARDSLHTVSVNGVDLLLDEAAEARLLGGGGESVNRAETAAYSTAADSAAAGAAADSAATGTAADSAAADAGPLPSADTAETKTDAQWAVETGILSTADGLDRLLDRGQTMEYLYRFARWAGTDVSCSGNLEAWPDGGGVPEAARAALSWGIESGVYRTIADDALSPSAPVSRGQMARLVTALVAIIPPVAADSADTEYNTYSGDGEFDTYSTYAVNAVPDDPWASPVTESGTDPWASPVTESGTDPWAGPVTESAVPDDPWAAPDDPSTSPVAEERPLADDVLAELAVSDTQDGAASGTASAQSPEGTQSEQQTLAAEITSRTDRGMPESKSRARHAELQEAIEAAAKRYHATGLQVAVIEDGKLTDVYSTGWAVKNSVAMTPDHRFRTASISKVMVGLAAMCLREQGVVDLDAPIGTYWDAAIRNPNYPNTPVNIRSLLTHTSSIYTSEVSLSADAVRTRLTSGRGFGRGKPGSLSNWNYNNYAFGVLGLTLEKAAHKTLDQVLDQSLFSAMGIDASFYGGDVERRDLVSPIYAGGTLRRTVEKQLSAHAGAPGGNGVYFAGGFTISVRDLGKIAALLANDGVYEGVRLLSAESVELMEYREKVWLDGGFCQAMPLRYRMDAYGRERLYYHTGSAYGAFNGFSYDPDARDGVVVLTSGASGEKDRNGNYAVCGAIFDAVYKAIAR